MTTRIYIKIYIKLENTMRMTEKHTAWNKLNYTKHHTDISNSFLGQG